MNTNLSTRSYQPELMDDLSAGGAEMDQTLRELEMVNRYLGGNASATEALQKVWQRCGNSLQRPLSVLDVGTGGGDILRHLAKKFTKQQYVFTGVDANANIVVSAEEWSKNFTNIHYRVLNVFTDELEQPYDIVMCNMVAHHFNEQEMAFLMQWMKRHAKIAVVVNDLHRHPLAYHSIKWLTAGFSRSAMVKHDAALSVARAFRKRELQKYFTEAGFSRTEIRWRWAFRYMCIGWV